MEAEEANRFFHALYVKGVFIGEGEGVGAVQGEGKVLFSFRYADFDDFILSEHHGEALEGVGADGDDDDAVVGGAQHRAAAGEGVAGGAGGRGNNEAVGGVFLDETVVDEEAEAGELAYGFMAHDYVIQHMGQFFPMTVSMDDGRRQEKAVFFPVAAGEDFIQPFFHIRKGDGIQEPQVSQMEAGHEYIIILEGAGGAKEGAVAAYGENEVPLPHDFFRFIGFFCKSHFHETLSHGKRKAVVYFFQPEEAGQGRKGLL